VNIIFKNRYVDVVKYINYEV